MTKSATLPWTVAQKADRLAMHRDGNTITGKHVKAVVSKALTGWEIEVATAWGKPSFLDSDGTHYKADAIERAIELVYRWDGEVDAQGRDNW